MTSSNSAAMRSGVALFVAAFLALFATAQQQTVWKEQKVIEVKARDVSVDQLNNLYAMRHGEIVKMEVSGKEVARYSNKLIGDQVQIDVSNPMKVLVHSSDQMRLIFLDSRLSELREEINLYNEGYEQISLAATSHSNGFWLYDPINFKLIRYDQYFKKERESLNIAQLLRVEFFPTDMVEVNNRVYLTDPAHGIYVFDVFGNYLHRIPLKGIPHLKVSDQRIFYQKADRLYAFHLVDGSEEAVALERPLNDRFDVNRNLICEVGPAGIFIFRPKP